MANHDLHHLARAPATAQQSVQRRPEPPQVAPLDRQPASLLELQPHQDGLGGRVLLLVDGEPPAPQDGGDVVTAPRDQRRVVAKHVEVVHVAGGGRRGSGQQGHTSPTVLNDLRVRETRRCHSPHGDSLAEVHRPRPAHGQDGEARREAGAGGDALAVQLGDASEGGRQRRQREVVLQARHGPQAVKGIIQVPAGHVHRQVARLDGRDRRCSRQPSSRGWMKESVPVARVEDDALLARLLPDKKETNHMLGSGGHLETQHPTLMKPPNKLAIQNWIPSQTRVNERSVRARVLGSAQRLVGRREQVVSPVPRPISVVLSEAAQQVDWTSPHLRPGDQLLGVRDPGAAVVGVDGGALRSSRRASSQKPGSLGIAPIPR